MLETPGRGHSLCPDSASVSDGSAELAVAKCSQDLEANWELWQLSVLSEGRRARKPCSLKPGA